MRLKNIVMVVTKDDILSFLKLQNKVKVTDITISECIELLGEFEFLNMKIKFNAKAEFSRVEDNNVYIIISNFKILKMNILNSVSKKAFNYALKAFTDISGVEFEGSDLKISIDKLVDRYCENQEVINLNTVQATDFKIVGGEIEVIFGGIEIKTNSLQKEIYKEVEYVDVKIDDDDDEVASDIELSVEKIVEYKDEFDEGTFFEKIKKYGKTAGVSVIYATLILYYTYKDKNVPIKAKLISLGALGYFIIPTDLILDILMVTGYTDDLLALLTAIKSITDCINDDIKLKAKVRLTEWFEDIDEKDLESVNMYI